MQLCDATDYRTAMEQAAETRNACDRGMRKLACAVVQLAHASIVCCLTNLGGGGGERVVCRALTSGGSRSSCGSQRRAQAMPPCRPASRDQPGNLRGVRAQDQSTPTAAPLVTRNTTSLRACMLAAAQDLSSGNTSCHHRSSQHLLPARAPSHGNAPT
jgi:hypothetical protein